MFASFPSHFLIISSLLMFVESAVCKFLDVPGKPRNMDIIDIDRDHLTLRWEPPESDGNAPLETYMIERREHSEKDWRTVGEVPVTKQSFVDEKVVEGKEYYYRVRAANKAGYGDPCDHNKPAAKIKAKPGSNHLLATKNCHYSSTEYTSILFHIYIIIIIRRL